MPDNDPVASEDSAPYVVRHSSVENAKSSVQNIKSSVQNEKSSVEIIRMVSENPKITAVQMAEKLGITTRAVEKQLANLRKKGIITRVGPNKGGHWEVKQ